jgi:hypothetical protein
MAECKYLEECPIFARFKNDGGKAAWLEVYCWSSCDSCERYKMREDGKEPPPTMLPNGTHVAHLARED